MNKIVFDASIYIEALRVGRGDVFQARTQREAVIYLSTVVGSELRRGAKEHRDLRFVNGLWHDFARVKRLIVPSAADWRESGALLAQIAAKYGYEHVGQARLLHDSLKALSARRYGAAVATHNQADFARIAEFRPFRLLPA